MKRIFFLTVLALSLPIASFATSTVDFSNSGGTLSGSNLGLMLSGSVLFAVNGLNGGSIITGDNLGSVTFTTGALISGSLQKGGMFAGGGSLAITGNGTSGLPNGTIFSGMFSGPVTWTLLTLGNGTHNYTLTGMLTGSLQGVAVQGAIVQLTVNTGASLFSGTASISSGNITLSTGVIPEPGSLALMGTGLLGVAGLLRRKRRG